MRVDVKDAGPCRKVVTIEVPPETVKEEYDRVLAAYAGEAKVPGFRPGRAPRGVVEKRFAKQIVEEVKDRVVPRSYHEALEREKLDVVAILGVSDVTYEVGGPLAFKLTLDAPPDFKLPSYKGLPFEGRKVEVSDQDVDDALAALRSQYATFEDVSGRCVQKDDLVQIDYEGVCDGKPVEQMLTEESRGAGKGEGFWLRVEDDTFLPGLAAGLLGGAVGEKKQVFVDFKDKAPVPALAGKQATYFVDIKAIREEKLPELGKELFDKLQVDSKEALLAKIRQDLQQYRQQHERARLKGEVVRHLLGHTSFDLPESLVQHETRNAIYEIVRASTARGMPRGELEGKKGEIFEVAAKSAAERVKTRYILHRIAEEEKIAVTDEELGKHLDLMAARYGMEPARLRAELESRQSLENVAEDLRVEKTLDFLLEQARVKV